MLGVLLGPLLNFKFIIMKVRLSFCNTLLAGIVLLSIQSCKKEVSNTKTSVVAVTDIDGNIYHSVTIGTQVWLVENLKKTRYRNGDRLLDVTVNANWGKTWLGEYGWYNNDSVANKGVYGALYDFHAAIDSRGIAPTGWHVPTTIEWGTLVNYLADSIAGNKLKESGTTHWKTPAGVSSNNRGTNITGFTALPGGIRSTTGLFTGISYVGKWWAIEEVKLFTALSVEGMDSYYYNVTSVNEVENAGCSIRCIKD